MFSGLVRQVKEILCVGTSTMAELLLREEMDDKVREEENLMMSVLAISSVHESISRIEDRELEN